MAPIRCLPCVSAPIGVRRSTGLPNIVAAQPGLGILSAGSHQ